MTTAMTRLSQCERNGSIRLAREPHSRLRLAVYGFVDTESGSLASANCLLLDELLRRGHSIDFYAIAGFVRPRSLESRQGYRYIPVEIKAITTAWRIVEAVARGRLRAPAMTGMAQISNSVYHSAIGRSIRQGHATRGYDALLVLGLLSPFRVGGSLTVLSWTQGTPTGELAAIRGQAATIRRLCGRRLYLTLVGYYRWKTWAVRRLLPRAGTLICASRWEAEQWRGLTEPGRSIEVLPYPYDVDRFRPVQRQPDAPGAVTFLHLGRIVPRKRLDLLLEAFQRVRRELPAAKLLLIGRFAYASGFRRLLSDPVLSQNVEYRAGIPRGEVPDLLGRVDLVIQTSENENLGSAIAEAQCCGLPVILGPTNGTKDYVAPSSFVFTAYTPEAVAAAMLQAARAIQGGRAELSADARAAASRHFSLPAVVDRLEGILARASRRTPSRKGCP